MTLPYELAKLVQDLQAFVQTGTRVLKALEKKLDADR